MLDDIGADDLGCAHSRRCKLEPPGVLTKTITKGVMKKLIGYSVVLALAGLFTGCVAPTGPIGGLAGSIYTDVSGPVFVTSHTGSSKMGEATSQGILGFVQRGHQHQGCGDERWNHQDP